MQTVGLIASIGGTAISAIGQIQQANAMASAANANAQLATQEAAAKREAYKYEGLKLSRERSAMLEEQKALYGASGIDISTGSPLDVMARTASEYERDIGYTGIAAGQAYAKGENEAAIYRYMARQYKTAGWLGAGSTLLSGFGKLGMAKYGGRSGSW